MLKKGTPGSGVEQRVPPGAALGVREQTGGAGQAKPSEEACSGCPGQRSTYEPLLPLSSLLFSGEVTAPWKPPSSRVLPFPEAERQP